MERSLVKYLLQTLEKNDHIDMRGGGLLEQTDTFNLKMTFWFPTASLVKQSWTPGAKVSRINLRVQQSLGSFVKLQVPL